MTSPRSPRITTPRQPPVVICGRRVVCTTKSGILLLFVVSCLVTYQSLTNMTRLTLVVDEDDQVPLLDAYRSRRTSKTAFSVNTSSSLLPNFKVDAFLQSYWNETGEVSSLEGEEEDDEVLPSKAVVVNSSSWNQSTTLPQWMKGYFSWHQQQRQLLNATNWKDHRFLIMTCFHGTRCGGVTDRLRPVLAMIRAAQKSHRLLLIYWERPFALEEFLEPAGLDWRVPPYLIEPLKRVTPSSNLKQFATPKTQLAICNTLYQSWNYGWLWYNEHLSKDEPPAVEVFREAWNTVFQMTPPVQALFDQTFPSLGLVPGEFATAHIRALYDLESRPHSQTVGLVRNAMNCASTLRPGGPFLVASDLLDALHEAQKYGKEKNVTVVTPSWDQEPLHIGLHNESDTSVTPQDFYTVFVDIYLLSQSRCVAVGPGGFGYWAQVMGHDHNCWVRHSGERSKKCEWQEKEPPKALATGEQKEQRATWVMKQAEEAQKKKAELQLPINEEQLLRAQEEEERKRRFHPVHVNITYNTKYELWENSTAVPGWIQQYFEWHKEQRALLTEENFRKQRYIVMTCRRGAKCGGMTDRLRPILTQIQVAHKTSRLFFIYWERPFPLEKFLLPPSGGLDWRMPTFMVEELYKTQITANLDLKFYDRQEPMIVSTMHQSWHYGELQYNERKAEDEPEAATVFRDVWNAVFTPSPPVAQMIADSFHVLGIQPGHYATAHIRALYGIEKRGTRDIRAMVNNALNCLSRLRPGGPYLVASDSSEAIRLAKEYGAYRNVTVVAPPHGKHPLHLGLHNESDTSIVPSDFYDIFNDMYLIAETRCMVVGKGGFGRWGILLGHDPSCNTFSNGFKAETCGWHHPPPGFQMEPPPAASQARMTIFRNPMD